MTTQITGGKVLFSETKQIAQYEPRRVEVELTFSVAEGDNADEFLTFVSEKAKAKVLEMLLGTKPQVIQKAEPTKTATEINETAKPKPTARGKKPEPAKPVEPDPFDEAEAKVVDDQTVAKLEEALGEDTWNIEPAKEITDAELSSECSKKAAFFMQKDGTNNAVAIKGIIKKFTTDGQPHVSSIPQDKRQEFIDALGKL